MNVKKLVVCVCTRTGTGAGTGAGAGTVGSLPSTLWVLGLNSGLRFHGKCLFLLSHLLGSGNK